MEIDTVTCPTPSTFPQKFPSSPPQAFPASFAARPERREPTPEPRANPLERLSQLMLSNDRLMDELASSWLRISEARAYLDGTCNNVRFGEAHLDRCRMRHSGILAQLRANRIEALQLLGEGGSGV